VAYRIFVSHVWRAQHEYYWGLIRLLAGAKRFKFVDLSVPKLRPFDGDYSLVRDEILGLLRTADVVLIINTPVITNSAPVQDELREAERLGIPIIAIAPPKRHGKTKTSQAAAIQRAHTAHWTTKSIVDAIRRVVREKPAAAAATLAVDATYELVGSAATEVPLSQAEVTEVRGDDEPSFGSGPQEGPTPHDVLYKEKAIIPTPGPKRPWFRKWW
jgi:sugar phosphate isomerase/epimerase